MKRVTENLVRVEVQNDTSKDRTNVMKELYEIEKYTRNYQLVRTPVHIFSKRSGQMNFLT